MGVVSSEISISEKVGNNPFPAFLYFQRFTASPARVAQVSRHLPGRLRRLRRSHGICRGVCAGCAGLAAFAAAFAQVALGLTAFTGAAGEKCAEAKNCLRRTLVSVGAEERFPKRLKETSMNELFSDESVNMLLYNGKLFGNMWDAMFSKVENFILVHDRRNFPLSSTFVPCNTARKWLE